jgi:hypothetical protein
MVTSVRETLEIEENVLNLFCKDKRKRAEKNANEKKVVEIIYRFFMSSSSSCWWLKGNRELEAKFIGKFYRH